MDGNDNHIALAELAALGGHAAAALWQGDVPFFGDKEFGVEAEGEEAVHDAGWFINFAGFTFLLL